MLIIQNEETVQEIWDVSKRVACLFDGNATSPFTVHASLSVTDANQHDGIAAAVLFGTGLDAAPVSGPIKIGDNLTLVIHVPPAEMTGDVHITSCIAFFGDPSNQSTRVQLIDENGCLLRPKLMTAFQQNGASFFALISAFRLADQDSLSFACQVDICSGQCSKNDTSCPDNLLQPSYSSSTLRPTTSALRPFTVTSPSTPIPAITSQRPSQEASFTTFPPQTTSTSVPSRLPSYVVSKPAQSYYPYPSNSRPTYPPAYPTYQKPYYSPVYTTVRPIYQSTRRPCYSGYYCPPSQQQQNAAPSNSHKKPFKPHQVAHYY